MSQTGDFYRNEVQYWRGIGAIGISTLCIPVSVILLFATINFSPFAAYTWLLDLFWLILSLKTWCFLILMCIVFIVSAASSTRFFTVVDEECGSRLARIGAVLHLRSIQHVFAQCFACAVMLWCLFGITGGRYSSCTTFEEESGQNVLNERHVFMLLHAMYIGLWSGVSFFTSGHNVLKYPPIQQPVWNATRDQLIPIVKRAFMFVLKKTAYFYLGYYIVLGAIVKGWLGRYCNLSSTYHVDSIWGMFDLHLLVCTCASATWIVSNVLLFYFIHSLYQTEPYEMAIRNDSGECRLSEALAADSYPLLQFQGYHDLWRLSHGSVARRTELFSLSPLGGHPHHWAPVCEQSLSSLKTLTQHLQAHNHTTQGLTSTSPTARPPPLTTNGGALASSISANGAAVKATSAPTMKDQVLKWLQHTKAWSYLAATPSDVTLKQVFAHAQKHVWNIQALAELIVASYEEDRYGVVQKSLAEVIQTLVTLRDELEKLCMLSGSGTGCGGGSAGRWNETGRGGLDPHSLLRATLKSSLYRVVNTFAPHVDFLDLTADIKKRLHLFAEYKM